MTKFLKISAVALGMLTTLGFTSCSSDSGPVEHDIYIRVNPSTILENFEEIIPGELSIIPSSTGWKLKVNLFLYDENGALIYNTSESFGDYTHQMYTSASLEEGKSYTAVAVSYIDAPNDSDGAFSFWSVTNEELLSSFKIEFDNRVGAQYNILGYNIENFSVGEVNNEIEINLRSIGSLILNMTGGLDLLDVSYVYLFSNRANDYATIGSLSQLNYSFKSDSYPKYAISTTSHYSDYVYSYAFVMPFGSTLFQVDIKDSSDTLYYLTEVFTMNIVKDSEYAIITELYEKDGSLYYSLDYDVVSRSGIIPQDIQPAPLDFETISKKSDAFQPISLSYNDLIKL